MTYEELNEVNRLRKAIKIGQEKIKALRDCATSSGVSKYGKENISTQNTTSRVEILTSLIVDTEKEISELQKRLIETIPALTAKIQAEIADSTEQTLMIYRYVACKYFRDIGIEMGYSEQHIYYLHNRILKNLRVDKS